MSFGTMLLIVVIVFLVFGPEKVPEVGRALGRAMHEFRKAMSEIERSVDEQAQPVRKAISEVREAADAHAAEMSKAVSISEPQPVKKPEEPQKPEC
ncbi:MAG: twin-arginine translocase TatA/TatE family subunit [Candidatus Brocadiia bacterium]